MDDPDPTGRWGPLCRPSDLMAEADWIHEHSPEAKTFIAMMNLGSSASPSFAGSYTPANSHLDLFGIAPYPCRLGSPSCDLGMIGKFVDAAIGSGIPRDRIVPIYQTFGYGTWRADNSTSYRLPTAPEMKEMLCVWHQAAPNPAFDYAYSWGSQRQDWHLTHPRSCKPYSANIIVRTHARAVRPSSKLLHQERPHFLLHVGGRKTLA